MNGVPSGAGEFTYAKDKDTLNYQGNFENGNAKGKGTLKTTFLDVKFPTVTRIGTYSGEAIDEIPNGIGEFTSKIDGVNCTYKGEWENGIFNGQGETRWNDKAHCNCIGTFKNGVFTPTIRELCVSFGTDPNLSYDVSDKAQTFLDKHTSFFPSKSQQELESYVDSSIKWEHIAKNPNDFGDHLIKLSSVHVTQVNEFQMEDGRYGTSLITMGSDGKVYYTLYPGKCNVYEGNIITLYGLPIGYSSYSNVSGGTTLACMLAGCYIA